MLGYALHARLRRGSDKMYAMVDIGQTMFLYRLLALKAAGGEKMTPKFIVKKHADQ